MPHQYSLFASNGQIEIKVTVPDKYPETPGFKEPTTSRDAAEKIKPRVYTLRDQVLEIITGAGGRGMTADEVADAMKRTVLAIRPRLSELVAGEKIQKHPDGDRRTNESGLLAAVWVAK